MASNEDIEAKLVPLWPHAGKALGYRSRSATYYAADKGFIKTVRLGKLRKVPTAWLERKTAGEDEEAADLRLEKSSFWPELTMF